jgi:hypothetical protein
MADTPKADRELLEAAAKAAGYVGFRSTTFASDMYMVEDTDGDWHPWNPHTDDGDALRLAVKLGLFTGPEFYHFRSLERFAGQDADEYTATRRAIVRAAAALASSDAGRG